MSQDLRLISSEQSSSSNDQLSTTAFYKINKRMEYSRNFTSKHIHYALQAHANAEYGYLACKVLDRFS